MVIRNNDNNQIRDNMERLVFLFEPDRNWDMKTAAQATRPRRLLKVLKV